MSWVVDPDWTDGRREDLQVSVQDETYWHERAWSELKRFREICVATPDCRVECLKWCIGPAERDRGKMEQVLGEWGTPSQLRRGGAGVMYT